MQRPPRWTSPSSDQPVAPGSHLTRPSLSLLICEVGAAKPPGQVVSERPWADPSLAGLHLCRSSSSGFQRLGRHKPPSALRVGAQPEPPQEATWRCHTAQWPCSPRAWLPGSRGGQVAQSCPPRQGPQGVCGRAGGVRGPGAVPAASARLRWRAPCAKAPVPREAARSCCCQDSPSRDG